ncbi:MAG: hypothetical protein K2H52_06370 [Lachnospiraceae bacterium]|nr:hypothetical protein [Lachnospiraceae bacterium]
MTRQIIIQQSVRLFMSILANGVTEFAYGVAIYHSATAKSRSEGMEEVEDARGREEYS